MHPRLTSNLMTLGQLGNCAFEPALKVFPMMRDGSPRSTHMPPWSARAATLRWRTDHTIHAFVAPASRWSARRRAGLPRRCNQSASTMTVSSVSLPGWLNTSSL